MVKNSSKRRVTVDVSRLEYDLDSDELRELLDVSPDLWDDLADSQKLLLLARRGIQQAKDTNKKGRNNDG